MNTLLIGKGYWGQILKPKLENQTNLLYIADSNDDLNEILLRLNVDFVFICTPTNTHYDLVKLCLKHKKNIFCEKPFTGDFFKAKELFELSEKIGVKLFVDNIFLYRNEILRLRNELPTNIKFVWKKYEEHFKEDIFNTLLYHDIYLLLKIQDLDYTIDSCNVFDDSLQLKLTSNNVISEFQYDRLFLNEKEKKIHINELTINLSTPENDPLSDILENLKLGNIDFKSNKKITLKTLNLLNKIKNGCLYNTSTVFK